MGTVPEISGLPHRYRSVTACAVACACSRRHRRVARSEVISGRCDSDADLVVTVAIEMVRRYGENAPPYLRDQAEIAVGLGDQVSARAWEDIAEATEAVLRRSIAIILAAQNRPNSGIRKKSPALRWAPCPAH